MRRARVLALALGALLVASGGAVGYISYRAGDSLLHPERVLPATTPGDRGLAWQDVRFAASDGIELVGWWMPAEATPAGTALFLHGYGESKAQSLDAATFLHEAGYDVLAFDFRGHGASGGQLTTVGVLEQLDVRAALDWVDDRDEGPLRAALVGWSMGASVALLYAPTDERVAVVVADSAFTEVAAVAGAGVERYLGLPPWPFGPLAVRFAAWQAGVRVGDAAPLREMGRLTVPIALVHGTADSFIPVAHVHALAGAYGGEAALLVIDGADHVSSHATDPEAYERHVLGALARAFGR